MLSLTYQYAQLTVKKITIHRGSIAIMKRQIGRRSTLRVYRKVIIYGIFGLILLQQYLFTNLVRRHITTSIGKTSLTMSIRVESPHDHSFHKTETPASSPALTTLNPSKLEVRETGDQRFLVFQHIFTGQGEGNVMSGLLAAHLLAHESNRTVCVKYPSFQRVFQYKDSMHATTCRQLVTQESPQSKDRLIRNNYDESGFASECSLKEKLKSDQKVLYFSGNTYPRWPGVLPLNVDLLRSYYKPSKRLQDFLPWPIPPETVVHLRQPDGELDMREGLDDATLRALGGMLPKDTYLVTNRVEWYRFFEESFGWSHPPWNGIRHSALPAISWGKLPGLTKAASKEEEELQLWADWWTMCNAKRLYHTPSDFSLSSSRWNRHMESWTIHGMANGTQLNLGRDFDDEKATNLAPLTRRTTSEMKYCDPIAGISQEYKESKLRLVLAMAKRRRGKLESK